MITDGTATFVEFEGTPAQHQYTIPRYRFYCALSRLAYAVHNQRHATMIRAAFEDWVNEQTYYDHEDGFLGIADVGKRDTELCIL